MGGSSGGSSGGSRDCRGRCSCGSGRRGCFRLVVGHRRLVNTSGYADRSGGLGPGWWGSPGPAGSQVFGAVISIFFIFHPSIPQ